jgi:molybdate transport system regulatory protein
MAGTEGAKTSARNRFPGKVSNVLSGPAMSLVTLTAHGYPIIAAVTTQSVQDLNLKTDDSVVALVKATETMLAKADAAGLKISARNKISARITDIRQGSAMTALSLTAGDLQMTAVITRHAAEELGFREGEDVTAFFKATDVVLETA